jgi:hypothetical protein
MKKPEWLFGCPHGQQLSLLKYAFCKESGCSAENFSAEQQKPRPLVGILHFLKTI